MVGLGRGASRDFRNVWHGGSLGSAPMSVQTGDTVRRTFLPVWWPGFRIMGP